MALMVEAIRLSCSRKINWPPLVIADKAETPPRLPVTRCFGVWPRRAHVLPNRAVNEMLASS